MMRTKITLILVVCFTAFSFDSYAQNKNLTKNTKEQVTFDVSMTCQNCKKRIEKNIAFEKGVSDMQVDLPNKTVMVEYNPKKTNESKLQKAFEDLGYEVSVHQSDTVQ